MVKISHFKKIIKPKILYGLYFLLNILIIADIIAIIYLMLFDVSPIVEDLIIAFDLCVCVILLTEFCIKFYMSSPKKIFLKNNWLDLIASIPFDLILPAFFNSVRFIRLIRILKVLRVAVMFRKYFKGLGKFIKNTSFDKILSGIVITILVFTLLIFFTDPTIDLFNSFWYVIVTLTTVGYGDITPTTFNGKLLSILLIIVGVFIFSTITGAISSYFTDRILNTNQDSKNEFEEELKTIHNENKELKQEITDLKQEIIELKEFIKKGD